MIQSNKDILKFALVIAEMQSVCIKIKDKNVRAAAIQRIDDLIEIQKSFDIIQ